MEGSQESDGVPIGLQLRQVNVVITSYFLSHLLQSQHLHSSPFMGLPDIDDPTEVIRVSQSLYELIEDLVRGVIVPVHRVVGSTPCKLSLIYYILSLQDKRLLSFSV